MLADARFRVPDSGLPGQLKFIRGGSAIKDKMRRAALSTRLQNAFFCGLEDAALKRARELLVAPEASPMDRALANRALAFFFSAKGEPQAALQHIEEFLIAEGDGLKLAPNLVRTACVLKSFLLIELEQFDKALDNIDRRLSEQPGEMDQKFLLGSLKYRVSGYSEPSNLDNINKIYDEHNLANIHKKHNNDRVEFGNVRGQVAQIVHGPVVSVIVPAFNCEKTLSIALDGLLVQTWASLEIIIVDDASSDGTWSVIQSYHEIDARIKSLRHEVNQGAYAARNSGLRAATGSYVTVNDADDWSHPQRIQLQMEHILSGGSMANLSDGLRVTSRLDLAVRVDKSVIINKNMSSTLYGRDRILELGGWHQLRVGADSELIERHEASFGKVERLLPNVPLALILASDGSLTKKGPTSLASLEIGARREYKEAYRLWHRTAKPEELRCGTTPPFPLPSICVHGSSGLVEVDLLHICDTCEPEMDALVERWRMVGRSGITQGLLDWPTLGNCGKKRNLAVQRAINDGIVTPVVWGEAVVAQLCVAQIKCLENMCDRLPEINVQRIVVDALDRSVDYVTARKNLIAVTSKEPVFIADHDLVSGEIAGTLGIKMAAGGPGRMLVSRRDFVDQSKTVQRLARELAT